MVVVIPCPKCGRKLRVDSKAAGKSVKCPACAALIRVPTTESSPATKSTGPKRAETVTPARRAAPEQSPKRATAVRKEVVAPTVRRGAEEREPSDEAPPRRMASRTWRPAPGVLRVLVILLAIAAGIVSSVFGVIGAVNRSQNIEQLEKPGMAEFAQALAQLGSQKDAARVDLDTLRHDRFGFFIMIGNLAVAVIASILIERSLGWMAFVLLALAPIGPAILMPVTLLFTSLFFLAALGSLCVWRGQVRVVPISQS